MFNPNQFTILPLRALMNRFGYLIHPNSIRPLKSIVLQIGSNVCHQRAEKSRESTAPTNTRWLLDTAKTPSWPRGHVSIHTHGIRKKFPASGTALRGIWVPILNQLLFVRLIFWRDHQTTHSQSIHMERSNSIKWMNLQSLRLINRE